ncbi:serine/threonine-protein kinase [Nocardia transvalensis]|uniref:serine/threonine-protein kinase n=1 Tax=Nocardia transvalensis TaxID=37333 RepID=UPI0018941A62|nr:serine/threonine-protein kinase [Nocardia transvalensis]MBF6327372.1 protein kinase [Nocardia transvalensis]
MLDVGDVCAGYVIERVLDRAGMGSVYLARHPRLPRVVALKVLNRELFGRAEMRERFERAADLVSQLDHPGIVTVYDRGIDDGRPWISMQYVDGIDAGEVDAVALPPVRALQIVRKAAEALDYAHAVGVLHRGVKPGNILLARADERVLVTDFGLAGLLDDAALSSHPQLWATAVAHASPEQLTGIPVGPRADQYALACTLFRLLTRRTPFESTDSAEIVRGHLQLTPPTLGAIRPDLPPALDAVLARALAKRPEQRFDSCSEFAAAAWEAMHPPTTRYATPPPLPQPSAHAAPQYPYSAPAPVAQQRGRTGLAVGIALLVGVLVAVGALVVVVMRNGSSHPSAHGSAVTTAERPTSPEAIPSVVKTSPTTTDSNVMPPVATVIHDTFPRMVPAQGGKNSGFLNASCFFDTVNKDTKWDNLPYFGNWVAKANCPGAIDANPRGQYIYFLYDTSADAQAVIDGLLPNTKTDRSKDGRTYTTYTMPGIGSSGSTYMVTRFTGDTNRERILLLSIFQTTAENMNWWQSAPLN